MKFYIVYFDSITQYHKTNKGYYVGYKNKIEDEYSDDFIFAKKYKTLGSALKRIGLDYKHNSALKYISELEKENDIFNNNRIEVVKLSNSRTQKLNKINGKDYSPIKNIGKISSNELIDFFRKEGDKFLSSKECKYYKISSNIKSATEEEIEDFCS